MQINNVCVIGGSGFVGRHIVHLLAAQGRRVRVPTRNRERAKELIVLPTVDLVQADVHDDEKLRQMLKGMEAVSTWWAFCTKSAVEISGGHMSSCRCASPGCAQAWE
jgi:nucleoside-diphosphate-sugar epimerase